MTTGIYCIRHIVSNKRYIGKSINIERRLAQHKYHLQKLKPRKKAINRYLHAAVMKYGWNAFICEVLEKLPIDENIIGERELYWMDHFDSCNSKYGYNLRRDTSTGMIVHESTRQLQSKNNKGNLNNNYGNHWTPEMKSRMSKIKKEQHASGEIYDQQWRDRQGETSREFWANNPDKVTVMAAKVSAKKQQYRFRQLDCDGKLVKEWDTVDDIIKANPSWKWQNIYSVCNGYKKRIYGYKWEKIER